MKKTYTGLKPRIVIPSSELNKLRKIVLPYFIPACFAGQIKTVK